MIPIAQPQIGREEQQLVSEVLQSGMIACGPRVAEFEAAFARFIGAKHAIATTSGTTALHLKLLGVGVQPGDEVIVPSFSFIASANAVLMCDAHPVFCDVEPETFTMNPEHAKKLISERTKALMPVHLYGQPADMKPLLELGEAHNLAVVGDAAQAHGARLYGTYVGCFGDAECFSFYPTKNMTTGEGGMITTNDSELAEKVVSLRNHGRLKTKTGYEHGFLGFNYRMTDIAAAIGLAQLKKLPEFNKKRQRNAAFFDKQLAGIEGIQTPVVRAGAEHVYHQYTITCQHRSRIIEHLQKNKVGFGIYYPKALHQYPHLKQYGHPELRISEQLCTQVLSLPVHPGVSESDLQTIVSCFQ